MQGVYSNRNIERMTLNRLSYLYVCSILGLLRFYRLPVLTIGYPPPPPNINSCNNILVEGCA